MRGLLRVPGGRLALHGVVAIAVFVIAIAVLSGADPLLNYYAALVAMYATAMFGMVILVGLSGQVSLGNGALMAVGGYVFALTSLHWREVPLLGLPWNAVWSVVFAGLGGVVLGVLIGLIAARLRGPYLAGLTLGIAVGVPAIANRFPEFLGGENGLAIEVPYPEGGYAALDEALPVDDAATGAAVGATGLPTEQAGAEETLGAEDMLSLDDVMGGSAESALPTEQPGVEETLGADDMLSLEDVTAGSAAPLPEASPLPDATGGLTDVLGDPAAVAGFVVERYQAQIAIAVACIVGFLALNLVRGRQGAIWKAVRDDPIAASVSGINPGASKVSAFAVSSLFAALAGAVFAQILVFVGPGAFGLGLSLSLLVGIVLGGRGSLVGALIGAVLLVWLPEAVLSLSEGRGWSEGVTNNAPNLIYGLLVVLVVLLAPGGIVGSIQGWARKLRR